MDVLLLQIDQIAELCSSQSWQGLEIVHDLPGRGRGVMVTRHFHPHEVVCDYNGRLLSNKEGKAAYKLTPPDAMGYMFQFRHQGTSMWMDSTEEQPGPGRLINHSKCHSNVSTANSFE